MKSAEDTMSFALPSDLPPPPRRLRARPGIGWVPTVSRWFLRLFITPHCIVGVGLILSLLYTMLVLLFGTDMPGQITDFNIHQSKGKPVYHITYRYTVDQIDYFRELGVNAEQYANVQKGQPLAVRVFPAFPATSPQPQGPDNPWSNLPGNLLLVLFWNGILSMFVWMAWIAPWRKRQLLIHGAATGGQIIAKDRVTGGKGGPRYQVQYAYFVPQEETAGLAPMGLPCNGQMEVPVNDFTAADIGQSVTVIYDPRKPKRSLVYEFAEYVAEW